MPYKNEEEYKQYQKQYQKDNRKKENANRKKWNKNNPEKHQTTQRKYQTSDKGKFNTLKGDAKRRGKICNISFEEFVNIIINPCYYCNNLLGKKSVNSHGLDRKNNLIGYELDNVISCCWTCNKIKNDTLTCEEAKAAVDAVLKLRLLTVNEI